MWLGWTNANIDSRPRKRFLGLVRDDHEIFVANTFYVLTFPRFDGRAASQEKLLFTAFARDFWTMLDARKISARPVTSRSAWDSMP